MQDLFIPFLGMTMVFLMPDFGGIVILLLIFLIVLMMAGVRMRSLLVLMAGVLAIYIAIPFSLPLLEKLPFFSIKLLDLKPMLTHG